MGETYTYVNTFRRSFKKGNLNSFIRFNKKVKKEKSCGGNLKRSFPHRQGKAFVSPSRGDIGYLNLKLEEESKHFG